MSEIRRLFDTALMVRRRDRIAEQAGSHDFLLHRVADDLAERLDGINREFATVIDVGAYHGVVGRRISGRPGVARLVSIEPSAGLLAFASGDRVQAELDALPIAPGSADLVVSGLALHLVDDLPGTLVQIRRALRPDGLLLASLLGGATLTELRQAFLVAESEVSGGASPRVAPFADIRDVGALLQRAGFALPVVDSDVVTVTYADPLRLMAELKGMGASNMLLDRRRVPMTRALLARTAEIYRERFAEPDGRVRATFEIITVTAWSPHESQSRPLKPGSAKMRLADALGANQTRNPDD